MREALENRVLDSPFTREEIDLSAFYGAGKHRSYKRMAMGTYTATDLIRKHKFVDHAGWKITDYEIARAYLSTVWDMRPDQNRKRVPFNKSTVDYLQLGPPAWFSKPVRGELAYVDIKSCYFQLYSPLTLDMRFRADAKTFMMGLIPFIEKDWLKNEKPVRNGLVGITRATKRGEWHSGQYKEVFSYNKFLAPEFWGYLMFTLHSIAHEVIANFGCHYWNTDGCIVDANDAPAVQELIANEWNLHTVVKGIGEGAVFGYGSYDVGEAKTANQHASKPMDILLPYDPALAAKLKRWRAWALRVNSRGE